jgi:hypothetical protein
VTPWYAYLGAAVAIVSLTATAFAIVRRIVRFARRLAASVDRAVEVLEKWPATVAEVEKSTGELVELGVAVGRVDGAQRKNRTDLDELWRRYRIRFPDEKGPDE